MSPPRALTLRLLVLPVCQALLLPSLLPPPFPIKVELLDKSGERKTVHTELAPHFSSSRVLHVRFELPVSLHVEPHKGVMQISKDGGGLHRGDVLRRALGLTLARTLTLTLRNQTPTLTKPKP